MQAQSQEISELKERARACESEEWLPEAKISCEVSEELKRWLFELEEKYNADTQRLTQ